MPEPLVSIVMSVFNGESYLKEAVESILQQTFDDFEFIVINDASTDSSGVILDRYHDERIIIIGNETNRGLTSSLNKGIRKARGRYLARMDADDISSPSRLQKEIEFLDAHPGHAAVGSFARIIDEQSRLIRLCPHPVDDRAVRRYLRRDNCITHGSAMIRSDCLVEVGLYDETISRSQDYDLWLRLSQRYRLANIPEYLYSFRVHPRSIGERCREEQKRCVLLAKEKAFRSAIMSLLVPDDNRCGLPDGDVVPAADIPRGVTDYVAGYLADTEFRRHRYLPLRCLLCLIQTLTLGRVAPAAAYRQWASVWYARRVGKLLDRCRHQGMPPEETAHVLAQWMARILKKAMKPKD